MIETPPPSPFCAVSAALLGLGRNVGGWRARGFLGQALHLLLYGRLGRARVLFEGLVARYLAGTLVRRVLPRGLTPKVADEVAGVRGVRDWPARFGWLLRALQPAWLPIERTASWEAGVFGGALRAALETAEVQAMLREVPQAARVLGPVCRMVAIPPAVLRPGFVATVRVAREPVAKRVRAPVVLERWPLPRGVKAAIRRERALERARAEVVRFRIATYGI